jgi:hypothetical protein
MGERTDKRMKHTPGPWIIFNKLGVLSVMRGKKEVVHWAGFDSSRFPQQNIANARLIAAAPELLQSLRELMQAVEAELTGEPKNVPKSVWSDKWEKAEVAIHKAEAGEREK